MYQMNEPFISQSDFPGDQIHMENSGMVCLTHTSYLSSSNSKLLPGCNAIFNHVYGCPHQRHFITMGSVW